MVKGNGGTKEDGTMPTESTITVGWSSNGCPVVKTHDGHVLATILPSGDVLTSVFGLNAAISNSAILEFTLQAVDGDPVLIIRYKQSELSQDLPFGPLTGSERDAHNDWLQAVNQHYN
jgi:hypothetical protein